jgi:predicted  nucleic acid-binding Zn-ribbon protein
MTNDIQEIEKKIRKLQKKIVTLKNHKYQEMLEIELDHYKAFYNITKTIISPEQLTEIYEKLNMAGYNFPVD